MEQTVVGLSARGPVGRRGVGVDSLVSTGCIVGGATVWRSILFTKESIGECSLVDESVVLGNAVTGRCVTLRGVIVYDPHPPARG